MAKLSYGAGRCGLIGDYGYWIKDGLARDSNLGCWSGGGPNSPRRGAWTLWWTHADFGMIVVHQRDAIPRRPSCLDFFCQPVQFDGLLADVGVELAWSWRGVGVELAWSWRGVGVELARSRSKSSASALPEPEPKTPAAPWSNVLFHTETCTGWMSNSLAICWMVLAPLSASSATRALNSGSCLLRLLFMLCVFGLV